MMMAGGTIERRPVSMAWRVWLVLEMTILFGAMPLMMDHIIHAEKIPMFVALAPVLLVALILLLPDRTFSITRELTHSFSLMHALSILLVLLVVGGAATYWVLEYRPHWFLEFPRNRPQRFQQIMLLYPIFSVAAQEFVFRTFYFHRYGALFGKQLWLGVVLNAALFGFAHIVMGSAFAMWATAAGGLLLALRYALTKSYLAVFVEHTFWGWLIFTIGLGRFFFTGVPNVH